MSLSSSGLPHRRGRDNILRDLGEPGHVSFALGLGRLLSVVRSVPLVLLRRERHIGRRPAIDLVRVQCCLRKELEHHPCAPRAVLCTADRPEVSRPEGAGVLPVCDVIPRSSTIWSPLERDPFRVHVSKLNAAHPG